jgi:hypothetical protein
MVNCEYLSTRDSRSTKCRGAAARRADVMVAIPADRGADGE